MVDTCFQFNFADTAIRKIFFLTPFFIFSIVLSQAQETRNFILFSKSTQSTVPFATIRFDHGQNGTIANLDGKFSITTGLYKTLEIKCLGFRDEQINLPYNLDTIFLTIDGKNLEQVVVRPDREIIYDVLNKAIEQKKINNPDKYEWYSCNVYYKMLIDAKPSAIDTSREMREIQEMYENQHLLMTETYSKRTWKSPQHLQEEVKGTRFSGLKKAMYLGLVTDILPFHSYNEYITLNNKDYHNPVSTGYKTHYKFKLIDQLFIGTDTVWQIEFHPKNKTADEMDGVVFINSKGYAISHLIAKVFDTSLKRDVGIEQEYSLVDDNGISKWFPLHLNYYISWELPAGKSKTIIYDLKGSSLIDSVSFKQRVDFKFDRAHTVKFAVEADALTDSNWQKMRPISLDHREINTYQFMDSIGNKFKFDQIVSFMNRLPEGLLHYKFLDFDLMRLLAFNKFENTRLGLGIQTSENLIKWLSVGCWFGYGTQDHKMKYGGFGELFFDKNHEFSLGFEYSKDYEDPGRVKINKEIDADYLNYLLLSRVDEVTGYTVKLKKKLGYLSLEINYKNNTIEPRYTYNFMQGSGSHTNFTDVSYGLKLRYAYAERTYPYFGRYYSNGSKYPIIFGDVTYGNISSSGWSSNYIKALAGIFAEKHFNRLGKEKILIKAGKIWSEKETLPLSKLFAGTGYNGSQKSVGETSSNLYLFGGLMTMRPYDFYSDAFIGGTFNHQFDWKLYNVELVSHKFSSAPSIGLQYGWLSGTLTNPESQNGVVFSTPFKTYQEGGIILNNLVKLNYFNVLYLTLNCGYFTQITENMNGKLNSSVTFGISAEF